MSNPKANLSALQQAAEQGDAEAQQQLGERYFWGHDVEQDYTQAVEWFRQAAEQGNLLAQFNLGKCYETGQGVNHDCDAAFDLYVQAAAQGQADAEEALVALPYYCGHRSAQDYKLDIATWIGIPAPLYQRKEPLTKS